MPSPLTSSARLLAPRPSGRPLRRSGGDAFLVGALVLLLGFGGMFLARWWRQGFTAGASGPVPQGAYLWQWQWTEPVRDAARTAATATGENGGTLALLSVFCAEIEPITVVPDAPGNSSVRRVGDVDWPLLASLGRPVGLVVRLLRPVRGGEGNPDRHLPLSPSAGLFLPRAGAGEIGPDNEPFPTARRVLEELFAKSAAAGLKPAEVQLDFDCPPGKLPEYAAALTALRAAFPAQKLVPTALPAWLDANDFAAFAKTSGGYVLSFAGLERLNTPDRKPPVVRCRPFEVADAVVRAARLGVPFRVALPTDGLRLVLDADGHLVATAGEGLLLERRRPPAGGSERLWLSDAVEMARLVQEWTERRPAMLQGILWHRLPVAGDRLNWPTPTLRAVAAGRPPRAKINWQFSAPGADGQRELTLRNVGEAVAVMPPALTVNSPVDPLSVVPAAPYEIVPPDAKRPPHALLFRRRGEEDAESLRVRLPPGEGFLVATIRLPEDSPDTPGEDEIMADAEPEPTASSASPAVPR